jgi:hypothetical protein
VTGVQFKEFPPGWGHLFVPVGDRAEAIAGIAMYTPGSWRGIVAQRAAWWGVRLGGPRLLPGRARSWEPPMDPRTWHELQERLREHVGDYDSWAGYVRRGGRTGLLLLLLRDGASIGFVKARAGGSAVIDNEYRALTAAHRSRPSAFVALEPLASGDCGDWSYLITAPLPPRIHRRADDAVLARVLAQVEMALASHPRPAGTPDHWVPAHGDFAPWNLRRFRRGGTYLIDWEEAGWAPPGSDMVYYAACAAALGRPVRGFTIDAGEATRFCRDRVHARIGRRLGRGEPLTALDRGLLDALAPGAD